MANGKQRDSFLTDIVNHALPTFSSVADEQIRRISGLSDAHQVDDLRNEVEEWMTGIRPESVARWFSPPWIYLADLEPEQVSVLEQSLRKRLELRRAEGQERGWETE